jgi:signal transduction histidine kinase/DNA-binding response OmpR family regulator
MKKFLPVLIIILCGFLQAEESWLPQVSLDESWRWTELDRLGGYDIIVGAKGLNGEVWFAHKTGLLVYNGIDIENHPITELGLGRILNINIVRDGRVIVTLENHLVIWGNGRVRVIDCPESETFLRRKINQTSNGELFVATDSGVFQIQPDRLVNINIEATNITSILIDSSDNLWVAGARGQPLRVYELTGLAGQMVADLMFNFETQGNRWFGPILFMDSMNRVWVLDPDESDQSYLYDDYVRKPAIRGLGEQAMLLESLDVLETNDGGFWFFNNRRLARWEGQQLEVYSVEDYPIPSSYPYLVDLGAERLLLGGQRLVPKIIDLSGQRWATYAGLNFQGEDDEGGLWFLTKDRRVVRNHGEHWEVFSRETGLIESPNRIFISSDGMVWASGSDSNQAAVATFDGDDWAIHRFPDAGDTFSYLAVIETVNGDVVFGGGTPENELRVAGGGVVFRRSNGAYKGVHYAPPTFIQRVANIVEREGDGLIASAGDISRMGSGVPYIDEANEIFSNQWIDHMLVDRYNDLWIAGLGAGLYQFDGQEWRVHGYANGLETKNVVYLMEDAAHSGLIALTDKGLFYYDGVIWARWGFQMDFAFKRENHTLFQSSDGAVWLNFASRRWFLEQGDFGHHNYDFQTIRFNPDLTAPQTFAVIAASRYPEGSQIQIQLNGADFWDTTRAEDLVYSWRINEQEWAPFSRVTSITLSELNAGSYRLQVRARDMDGNVDATPAEVGFAVIPPLWKQAWFILLMVAIVLLIVHLLYALYRIRLKAALALDEFKFDFFTNISHELRNPLAVIISPVEMLLESDPDPKSRKRLQIVLRNARKMQGMIDQLLHFRRIEKAEWVVSFTPGEIIGFTREAVMSLEPLWSAKQQTLEFDASCDSLLCGFDAPILQKVVDNLVSNAVKYSDEETSIRVNVSVDAIDGHQHYHLNVTDNGIGIPLHEQKLILQPFYRIKHDNQQDGAGVGLALVNKLVNLWGGTIEIESPLQVDGAGTRMSVMLPLEDYVDAGVEHEDDGDDEQPAGRMNLLIVEDNEDMCEVLHDAFGGTYDVLEARNGVTGYELAQEHNPDLIISDVMMPEMNGFEMCRLVKTNPETSHIPVILLTARSAVEHRIVGIKSGADAYIAKPLDVKHLKARAENLLESRQELKNKFARQLVIEATDITVTPTDEVILSKAIRIVEENMQAEHFDVERFGELMGMSRSTLKRKLKAVTGLSPQPFIQKLRLKRAAKLLGSRGVSVSEVAATVGFYDLSYFGKVFKKEFGKSPSQFEREATR